MISIGQFNTLKAKRQTDNGFYLTCTEDYEVLLPNKYVPEDLSENDLLEVYVYKDSEDRIVATTLEPYIIVGEYAYLKCTDVAHFGAFVDVGLEKDLLIPLSEQREKMEKGKWYIVHAYLDDKTGRIVGTNKINRFLEPLDEEIKEGDEVELLITDRSDLGYNAVIEDHALGLLYQNEVHEPIQIGDRKMGYIKMIREDGKIDLALQKEGRAHIDASAQKILDRIKENGGVLHLNDDSSPEQINQELAMSKKAFKKAIGALYKQRVVQLTKEGIQLV